MLWFSGSINEAIVKSKKERKVFVVFITGNDDISRKMDGLYESLSAQLSSLPIVAIKLESQSDNCKMFSQICIQIINTLFIAIPVNASKDDFNACPTDPVILIPSTYFIDNNGVAIEIIGGSVDNKEVLFDKINTTIGVFEKGLSSDVSNNGSDSANNQKTTNPSISSENSKQIAIKSSTNESTATTSASVSTHSTTSSPSSGTSASETPTIDAKVERANQLIEAIREKKAREEADRVKAEELERRKGLKEMQNSKRMREEKEAQDVITEREREKREAKLARDRILAQIAADREERRARQMAFTDSTRTSGQTNGKTNSPDSSEGQTRQRIQSTSARIQFRLPDGSTQTNSFGADDSLETVRQYVTSNLNIRHFVLSTTFPRREFGANDYNQTLSELCLSPSSVLLVIPLKTGSSSSRALTSPTMFWQLLTYLFSPLVMIWNLMTSFFRSSNQSANSTDPTPRPDRRPDQRSKQFYSKDGNIARMREPKDDEKDEDDNNTWNGNSTQQM